ncbi:hypothetical protein CUMW_284780, partial [Citrus unshiu]
EFKVILFSGTYYLVRIEDAQKFNLLPITCDRHRNSTVSRSQQSCGSKFKFTDILTGVELAK